MLIVMDKSTHEEHLSQPLKTNNKQFKIAVSFLTAYNGIFNVTSKNKNFYFLKSISDDGHISFPYHLVLTKSKVWIEKLKD